MDKWRNSAFYDTEEDPLGPLANLVDIILVFACGLIAALVAYSPDLQQHFGKLEQRDITLGKELPTVPENIDRERTAGDGYEALGQVYRDPQTGKLILIGR
ncbi:DUF2149 domain-containing protein [Nitrogeniibacter aestuarii]|uniref:DUF2149 domain-containing protein n=1 Tax=Nitrogeniibacter aestuarii TaxID=2815343 RepID=UPI001E56B05F|nr:DUF2149 domain-containing protein [Nitrogeniibacter aestuarii]